MHSNVRVKSEDEDWFAKVIALLHIRQQADVQGRSLDVGVRHVSIILPGI